MEYLRARRHWPIWWTKLRATMRRWSSLGDGVEDGGPRDMLGSGFLSVSVAPGFATSTVPPGKKLVIVSAK
jgi:hypothetical protein